MQEPAPLRPAAGEKSKHETFKRLAEKRTNAILERIRVLGNLANRSAYDYTDQDLRKIFSAIDQELRIARAKFQSTGRRQFRLD